MTYAELENALWQAGLTRDQVREILPAIAGYATAQARAAIGTIGKVTAA